MFSVYLCAYEMRETFSPVQANAFLLSAGKHINVLMHICACIVSIIIHAKDEATLAISLQT